MAKLTFGEKIKRTFNPRYRAEQEKIENEKRAYDYEQNAGSLVELEKTNEKREQEQQSEIEKKNADSFKEYRYNCSLKRYDKAMEAVKYVRADMQEEWINLLNARRDTLSVQQYSDSKLDELAYVAEALEAQANGESIGEISEKLRLANNQVNFEVDWHYISIGGSTAGYDDFLKFSNDGAEIYKATVIDVLENQKRELIEQASINSNFDQNAIKNTEVALANAYDTFERYTQKEIVNTEEPELVR